MGSKNQENTTNDSKLEKYKEQFEDYLNLTSNSRSKAEQCRDYYDGHQWTDEEIKQLAKRKQAPIVVNRVKPKVEGLKGLLSIRKTDIKAFPRNQKQDEQGAYAFTDGLRYVFESNDFDTIKSECFEEKTIEGCCAATVDGNSKGDVIINRIPWDRFYYDPKSRKKDFSDARYMGEMVWLDKDQLIEYFPDKEDEIENLAEQDNTGTDTTQDKPLWSVGSKSRKRYRICKHYCIEGGKWTISVFCGDKFLLEPQDSPYLDEEGRPDNPIVADTAYIDRKNNRYSEVAAFISQQDEINHRRSKALHLLSSRQTAGKAGAIDDIEAMKREFSKPDGHIEYNGDKGDFEVLNNNDMTQGQFNLYQDAKAELDATSFNAQLSGDRQKGDLSGKAIDRLQSAGALEIDSLYKGTASWEKRIARKVSNRIRQFWTAEKWVRITDDQDNLRWVGFNTQITLQQFLEERINDESQPLPVRVGASAAFQTMMQNQDPRLKTIVSVKNRPAELDVDIILEQSFDVVNIQQEQFELLVQFAQSSKDIDIVELIELSQLRNKKQLIEKIEARRAQAAKATGDIATMKAQEIQVNNAKKFAETQKTTQEANQVAIENQMMIRNPNPVETNPIKVAA